MKKLLTIVVIFILLFTSCKQALERPSDILFKNGGTSTYNGKMLNYSLVTLDAGKNWYLINENRFEINETKIIGDVENIYPGLIKHLTKQDSIINSLLEKQQSK